MRPSAIADLVGTAVSTWSARCVAWRPDRLATGGQDDAPTRSSVMATILHLGDWPADLMNPFYAALDAIVGQVRDSLDEEDADDYPHDSWVTAHDHAASALREVTAAVLRHRPAILELLIECVEPRYPYSSELYP